MPSVHPSPVLVGNGSAMGAVRRFVARAAGVDAPVLLLGETGTGKSLLARVIYTGSPRVQGPFVAVNCAAVPEPLFESELFGHRRGTFTGAHEDRAGLVELAHRGTILLDEIGDLLGGQQAKLLTVIEESEVRPVGARRPVRVDVRVMSATSCDLERRIEESTFRRDLFHRLALLAIRLPPLRERAEDVPLLAAHFLTAAAARHCFACPRLDDAAVRLLTEHGWPGNVRELGHAVEAALILDEGGRFAESLATVLAGRASSASDADPTNASPRPARSGSDPRPRRYSFYGSGDDERLRIRAALDQCGGNRTRVARELGMSRNTLRIGCDATACDGVRYRVSRSIRRNRARGDCAVRGRPSRKRAGTLISRLARPRARSAASSPATAGSRVHSSVFAASSPRESASRRNQGEDGALPLQ